MNPAPPRLLPVDFDPFAGPEISHVYASTEAQREVFAAADWGAEASCAFNESWSLSLDGVFDAEAFTKAARQLVARHEALRSALSPDGATVVVFKHLAVDVARPQGAVAAHLAREVEQAFDLVRGPLFRMALFEESPTRHVFVFTAHHIVCDGWSAAILVKDLGHLYSAAKTSAQAQLEPAAKLSDYSAWEDERSASGAARADESYWLGEFAAGVPVLDLPLTKVRPQLKTYSSRREDVTVPKALLDTLKKVGAKEKSSLFTVLIGGFYVWLARVTGQESFVVGVPAAGQSVKGEATLVGHCVNLLPMHAAVPLQATFKEFLQSLRKKVLDGFDHQQFTYGTLLKKLPIERDPGRSPLVGVMFNLDQGLSESQLNYAGLKPTFVTTPRHFENFELFLNVIEISGTTTLECQYNTDLFEPETMQARLASFVKLLESIAANPDGRLHEFDLITTDERRRLTDEFNRTRTPAPHPESLIALFEEQAAKSPAAAAVTGSGKTLSYAELNGRANQLAAQLAKAGVKAGDLVGISMDRTPDLLVGLLGIMKAGAAYVPVDPTYPEARLQMMFEDARLGVLVSTAAVASQLPKHQATVVMIEAGSVAANPPRPASADALTAYVIFTSGSTGRPKGVAVPQGAVANFLTSMRKTPGMAAADTLLAVTTISFDIHVLELYLPLISGAKVVLATKEEAIDGTVLKDLIGRHGVTVMQATPATWRMLFDAGWSGQRTLRALCGGEPLPGELAERLLGHVASLWNMYGPTETTVWSTCHQVRDAKAKILIGRPIDNTTCYVVNQNLRLVPAGVAGELLIGGLGVTKGYVGRDDLTAEKFVPDPFGGQGKLYRTGDLARFHPNGELECLGRTDHQVKLRGFRIELGEIETALARHSAIATAVAGVRERAPGDPRLVAWYVEKPGAKAEPQELRQSLKGSLPDYMIPQVFKAVGELPLTPNGKVDRKRLPEPFDGADGATVRAKGKRSAITKRRHRAKVQKVTPFQRRLLDFERQAQGTTLYNLPTGFRIFGVLDLDALAGAVREFGSRHDMLKTRFVHTADGWMQEYDAAVQPELQVIDLRGRNQEDREAFLTKEFQAICERPFDLGRAPLFMISLYRLAEQENVLFMMSHQAVWDGWSFDIFVKELSALYQGQALSPLPLDYGDFADWHEGEVARGAFAEASSYWQRQLAMPPRALAWKSDRPRPARMSGRGKSTSYTMPRDLANTLTSVGQDAGATLFMVLLAAYKALIHRQTATNDVAVLTPVRGRSEAELEGLIGCFVNQIVLRSRLEAGEPFLDFLRKCRQTSLEGMSRDELPFTMMMAAAGVQETPAHAPLSQAAFSFQDARLRGTSFGSLPYKQINVEPTACGVDLNFWVKESHDNLTGSMNYATDLFDEETVRKFLASYNAVLYAIVKDPATPLDQLATTLDDAGIQEVKGWFEGIARIEAEAQRHAAVEQAAAAVLQGLAQPPRLVLHYVVKPGEYVTSTDLRRHLKAALGEGLTPQLITELDAFPRLASGNVDKQKLTAAHQAPLESDEAEATPPSTRAEKILATIWSELLGSPVKTKRANFFEVGGHSLLAIQMIARIERETGVKVTRMAVTLNTLEQIAQTLGLPDESPPESLEVAVTTGSPPKAKIGFTARLLGRLRGSGGA